MPEQAVAASSQTILEQGGVFGALLLLFAAVIVFLWRDAKAERTTLILKIEAANQGRLEDAKGYQAHLLEVTRVITTVGTSVDQQKDATIELKGSLKEFASVLEELRTEDKGPPTVKRRGV
jgi:hypothetical protein